MMTEDKKRNPSVRNGKDRPSGSGLPGGERGRKPVGCACHSPTACLPGSHGFPPRVVLSLNSSHEKAIVSHD